MKKENFQVGTINWYDKELACAGGVDVVIRKALEKLSAKNATVAIYGRVYGETPRCMHYQELPLKTPASKMAMEGMFENVFRAGHKGGFIDFGDAHKSSALPARFIEEIPDTEHDSVWALANCVDGRLYVGVSSRDLKNDYCAGVVLAVVVYLAKYYDDVHLKQSANFLAENLSETGWNRNLFTDLAGHMVDIALGDDGD